MLIANRLRQRSANAASRVSQTPRFPFERKKLQPIRELAKVARASAQQSIDRIPVGAFEKVSSQSTIGLHMPILRISRTAPLKSLVLRWCDRIYSMFVSSVNIKNRCRVAVSETVSRSPGGA